MPQNAVIRIMPAMTAERRFDQLCVCVCLEAYSGNVRVWPILFILCFIFSVLFLAFFTLTPFHTKFTFNFRHCYYTFLRLQVTTFHYKLELLSLASLSSLVKCLQVRPEPTQVKHLLGAPLQVRLQALSTNIRLGRKGLPGTNALAYYEKS
jgi:hypothetical protein